MQWADIKNLLQPARIDSIVFNLTSHLYRFAHLAMSQVKPDG